MITTFSLSAAAQRVFALRASLLASGKRVAIAEEYRYGGTCVIRGCVPKKLYVYASQFPEHFEDAAGYGWVLPEAKFDWRTLVANKDREIARLEGLYRQGVEKAGGDTFHSRAVLVDAAYRAYRGRGAHRHCRSDPDCDRRAAQSARRLARPRALHLLQRGVRPARTAEGDRDRGRRLHRRRVRQYLSWARRRDDPDLSRQGNPAAFRHGLAAYAA